MLKTNDVNTISGRVIEVSKNDFLIESAAGEKIVIFFSQLKETIKVEEGDSVIIEYKGKILETSPTRIKDITKILKE
jgi:RNase P/RNase MRP subunit p29